MKTCPRLCSSIRDRSVCFEGELSAFLRILQPLVYCLVDVPAEFDVKQLFRPRSGECAVVVDELQYQALFGQELRFDVSQQLLCPEVPTESLRFVCV